MRKIIHLSDLHIGFRNLEEKAIAVFDRIRAVITERPPRYIVVITGDLVNNATVAGSYERARKALDYLRTLGFKTILVVPGNHDYGTGNRGYKKFVPLFKEYFLDATVNFPKVDIIDSIAFIGLDSIASELHWYDRMWAEGELGRRQIEGLRSILGEGKVKACAKRVIYLHHHPFRWRPLHQLKDSRALKKVLSAAMQRGMSIDALLFGHNHEGNAHNGRWGIPRCYDGGTATLKSRPALVRWAVWYQVQASIRIIDLEQDPSTDIIVRI